MADKTWGLNLGGLQFYLRQVPRHRVVKIKAMMSCGGRAQYVLMGSRDQLYLTPMPNNTRPGADIKPGSFALDIAHALFKLGCIDKRQLQAFGDICRASDEFKQQREAAQRIEVLAQDIRMPLTKAQQAQLAELTAS